MRFNDGPLPHRAHVPHFSGSICAPIGLAWSRAAVSSGGDGEQVEDLMLERVERGPRGRWLPGPWSLEELPVPIAELEAIWARERRRRVKHAYRYR